METADEVQEANFRPNGPRPQLTSPCPSPWTRWQHPLTLSRRCGPNDERGLLGTDGAALGMQSAAESPGATARPSAEAIIEPRQLHLHLPPGGGHCVSCKRWPVSAEMRSLSCAIGAMGVWRNMSSAFWCSESDVRQWKYDAHIDGESAASGRRLLWRSSWMPQNPAIVSSCQVQGPSGILAPQASNSENSRPKATLESRCQSVADSAFGDVGRSLDLARGCEFDESNRRVVTCSPNGPRTGPREDHTRSIVTVAGTGGAVAQDEYGYLQDWSSSNFRGDTQHLLER
ncbi:uncharacterized protein BDR25DRAFT_317404 [Lindgomyces ingoldianus]|uniref:Uncharacterized protein n=1 Tax=Lindgomyces ingoldianus TaxID=673940 RepID=A0ACB6QIA5_9PLEO|nr:uncharacterized protein BDR25DRAFT_317404 [Lindgomyces ingoldianus]KAF2466723.1 hypothetical protein BDR25DRAFT_317404 [Lindgomyces ingoldianus]